MNEQLMKQVERAVRPVRAGKARKMQMREELLAHLTALHEEERERIGDDESALAAALLRFGNPAQIAVELDRSVGPAQRVVHAVECYGRWLEGWFEFRSDRSFPANMVRTGANLCAAIVLFFAVAIGLALFLVPERRDDPIFLPLMIKVVALAAISGCLVLWAAQTSIPRELGSQRPARWWVIAARGAGWSLALLAVAAAFWWWTAGNARAVLDVLPPMALTILVVFPATLVLIAWATRREAESQCVQRQWTALEIDE
jgi:hypothetical protein